MISKQHKNKIVIICRRTTIALKEFLPATFVGIESGCLELIDSNLSIDLAIGDWDSVTDEEKSLIFKKAKITYVLKENKDYTDTIAALNIIINRYTFDNLVIISNGNRIDMLLVLLGTLIKYNNKNVSYYDDNNFVKYITSQSKNYEIVNSFKNKYISFFAIENSEIKIKNAKYELHKWTKIPAGSDYTLSNELTEKKFAIKLNYGSGFLVLTRD